MSFAALIAGAKPLTDGLSLEVPDTWHQGRTAYGGFSAAVALQSALRCGGEGLPPLRSVVVSFIGPVYGRIESRARVHRRGKNATWIAAEITREGDVVMSATFVFMGPVTSGLHLNDCPAPADLVKLDEAGAVALNPHSPQFMQSHLCLRHALPRGDAPRPQVRRWVRLGERDDLDPMTEIVLLADALPPGVLPLLAAATPISSMTWQLNLLTAQPETRDGWYLLQSVGDYAENGCSSQIMRIWNADGAPIASGMQSVALFG